MYYSELVPGLMDLRTFNEFKDIQIRPLISGQIEKLYNIDEGSAFYTLLGMLYIGAEEKHWDCTTDEGLCRLHQMGKDKLDEIDMWTMSDNRLTVDVKLGLGLILAWQCDAAFITIHGHKLFSTVNGSYATSGDTTWSNYLVPGQMWARQRDEVIGYVRTNHQAMDVRQFRYVFRDCVMQIRKIYRGKSYMEYITVLNKCRELIKRK